MDDRGIEYFQYHSARRLHFGHEASRIMVTASSFAHLDVGYNIRQSIQSRPSNRPEIYVLQCMVFLFPFFPCLFSIVWRRARLEQLI